MEDFLGLGRLDYLKNYPADFIYNYFSKDFVSSYLAYRYWLVSLKGFSALKIALLGLGTWAVATGRLHPRGVFLFLHHVSLLEEPVEDFRVQLESAPGIKASVDRIERILEIKDSQAYGSMELEVPIEEILVENGFFSYGDYELLKDLNLSLVAGRVYALIGLSGSKKTTLVNLLGRLMDLDSGSIKFNGVDVRNYKKSSYQKEISFLAQNSSKSISKDWLLKTQLGPELEELKANVESGQNLSTGQIMLINLMETIYSQRSFIILDEAFTHMGVENVARLLQKFKDKKALVLFLTYSESLSQVADYMNSSNLLYQ